MIGPITAFRRLCLVFGDPDKRNLFTVPKFAQAHKEFLICIADPATDRIFVAHKGRFINGRIRSARGQATHVVRDMLKKGKFRQDPIDAFIASLTDILQIDLKAGNQFYSFIDGAIFNLAKHSHEARKAKKQKADRPPIPSSSIPSPISAEGGRAEGDI